MTEGLGSASLAGSGGSSALVAAVQWVEGTLLGTIATSIAVVAVASVGLLMLTGRVEWRHGARVVLGCFILFGASSIAAGIQELAVGGQDTLPPPAAPPDPPSYPIVSAPPAPAPAQPAASADPFAGAALPSR